MNLLIDTHTFIWFFEASTQLSSAAKAAVSKTDNRIYFSDVTIWEIAIKQSIGKLTLAAELSQVVDTYTGNGGEALRILPKYAATLQTLPWHHRDPFDRMLISQALTDDLVLVTRDGQFKQYGVKTLW